MFTIFVSWVIKNWPLKSLIDESAFDKPDEYYGVVDLEAVDRHEFWSFGLRHFSLTSFSHVFC